MATEDPDGHVAADEPAPGRRRRSRSALWRVGLSLAVILVLMLWILGAFRRGVIPAGRQAVAEDSAAGLATRVVGLQTLAAATEAVGTVQAEQVATITSRVVADVIEMRASAGQRVASGTTLAVLDDRDLRNGSGRRRTACAVRKPRWPRPGPTSHATSRSSISA